MRSEHSPDQLYELRNRLASILSSLKTVLERKALSKEDAQLIAIAYKNAQDLIKVTKKLFSESDWSEGNSILGSLKKEMENIVTRLPNVKEENLIPVYKSIKALDNLKPLLESHSTHELTDSDQNWLYQIGQNIENEISNFSFNVETLAGQIYISRRQLDRRLKLLTGFTTGQYIREIRMLKARQLILEKNMSSVKAVAARVGIKSISHFSKQYKSRFGKYPSDDLRLKKIEK